MTTIAFVELLQTAPENFSHYVESQSTRTQSQTKTDFYGRTTETTVFYRGSRILGKLVRDPLCGYRYYLRKD